MSRLSGAYDLGRFTGTCAATGRPLVPGAPCVVALCEATDAEEANAGTPFGLFLRRFDYSIEAWEGGSRPAGLLFFWRTTAQEGDARKKILVDDETLLDLFQRLEGDERPQRVAFRFVLALLLVRKKLLRVLEQRREPVNPGAEGATTEREVWLLQARGVEGSAPPLKVVNPRLRDQDVQEIAEQLGEIMQGNF